MGEKSGQLLGAEVVFLYSFLCACLSVQLVREFIMWSKSKVLRSGIVAPHNYLLVRTSRFHSNSSPPFRGQGLEKGRLPWQLQSEPHNASTFCTSPGVGRVTFDESCGTTLAVLYNLHESAEEQSRWWCLSGLCSKPV